MNNLKPIIPPESVLSGLYQGGWRTRITLPVIVFGILALHVMFLGGLLIQGCKHAEGNPPLSSALAATAGLALPSSSSSTRSRPTDPISPMAASSVASGSARVLRIATPAPVLNDRFILPEDSSSVVDGGSGSSSSAFSNVPPGNDAAELEPRGIKTAPTVLPEKPVLAASPESRSVPGMTARASHVIRPGDTLGKIAKAHGISIKSLRAANGLTNDRLVVGRALEVPKEPREPKETPLGSERKL